MNEPRSAVEAATPLEERPPRQSFLPFCRPFVEQEEKDEVLAALESGWLSTGPRTKQFEARMGEYLGVRHAIAVSSCTAGLHVALVAAGIGAGDEVITSPLTFVSTANVILHAGATPVFADIRRDSYNISAGEIEKRITPRTKAIIPVHYAGQPCDMDEIRALARSRGILVIEDAAHAIGAAYQGKLVGSDVEGFTVFSFYATKNLTTGEGGMVITDRDDLAERVRLLGLHGITHDAWKRYSATGSWYYEVVAPGYKYNMTDVQSALGLIQLKRLPWFIERRELISGQYNQAFADLPEILTPWVAPHVRHARHLYPIVVDSARLKINRGEFIEALKAENIGTSVHFIPVHLHPYYRDTFGYKRGDFPNAEWVYDGMISLPLYPHMTVDEVSDVCGAVRRTVLRNRR